LSEQVGGNYWDSVLFFPSWELMTMRSIPFLEISIKVNTPGCQKGPGGKDGGDGELQNTQHSIGDGCSHYQMVSLGLALRAVSDVFKVK